MPSRGKGRTAYIAATILDNFHKVAILQDIRIIVLTLDGNTEMGAHVWSVFWSV